MRKGFQAYNLADSSRSEILKNFKPSFSEVILHHVTIAFGVEESKPLPSKSDTLTVIGHAKNDRIECFVVEVNGSTGREDGGTFHLTISHVKGAKPFESNELIKNGFDLVTPFEIKATPTFNPFGK